METARVGGIVQVPGVGSTVSPQIERVPSGAATFKDTLQEVQQKVPFSSGQEGLSAHTAAAEAKEGVKFSNHALDRMRARGIFYSAQDMSRINEAVAKASAKGARDSLILMNDSALIVSVKNNTIVTVMDKNALKENVFTNIDSTIVM